jgi:hypothetical protein
MFSLRLRLAVFWEKGLFLMKLFTVDVLETKTIFFTLLNAKDSKYCTIFSWENFSLLFIYQWRSVSGSQGNSAFP